MKHNTQRNHVKISSIIYFSNLNNAETALCRTDFINCYSKYLYFFTVISNLLLKVCIKLTHFYKIIFRSFCASDHLCSIYLVAMLLVRSLKLLIFLHNIACCSFFFLFGTFLLKLTLTDYNTVIPIVSFTSVFLPYSFLSFSFFFSPTFWHIIINILLIV